MSRFRQAAVIAWVVSTGIAWAGETAGELRLEQAQRQQRIELERSQIEEPPEPESMGSPNGLVERQRAEQAQLQARQRQDLQIRQQQNRVAPGPPGVPEQPRLMQGYEAQIRQQNLQQRMQRLTAPGRLHPPPP